MYEARRKGNSKENQKREGGPRDDNDQNEDGRKGR